MINDIDKQKPVMRGCGRRSDAPSATCTANFPTRLICGATFLSEIFLPVLFLFEPQYPDLSFWDKNQN